MNDKLFSSPRWFVWFFQFLDKIPISKWFLVSVFLLISAVAHHLIAWQDGYLDQGKFSSYLSSAAVYWVLIPIWWHVLSTRAIEKVGKFLSGNEKNKKEISETILDFNSLPENTSIIVVGIGFVVGYFSYHRIAIVSIPISAFVLPWFSLISWILGAGLGYLIVARMIRQTVLMRRLYQETRVDLFDPSRIYSLTEYGLFSALSLLFIYYLLVLISFPSHLLSLLGFIYQLLFAIVSSLLFFVPLLGVNRRMKQAKDELVIQASKDIRDLYLKIHSAAEVEEYEVVGDLQNSLLTLQSSKAMIEKISIWPWQPHTIRNLFAPFLIPIFLILIQIFLENVIGI